MLVMPEVQKQNEIKIKVMQQKDVAYHHQVYDIVETVWCKKH